jgi:hypothetical protein
MAEVLLKVTGDARELETVIPAPKSRFHKVKRSYWSSPEQMAREVRTWDRRQAWTDLGWIGNDPDWYGSNSMEETLNLAEEGWKKGIEKASRLQNRIRANNPIMLKRKSFSIAGATPDVPRAISGDPENMRVPDVSKASRRVVITLFSDMSAHCGHNGVEFINRAAVLAAIVDEVEAAGYACDVITFANSQSGWDGNKGFNFCSCIQVKNSNQPVDISRLAFGLGHTSLFRRMVFAEKGHDHFCKDLGSGLGHADDLDLTGMAERNIFLLPSVRNANGAFDTEEKAETEGVQFIIKALEGQGFPVLKTEEFRNSKQELAKAA